LALSEAPAYSPVLRLTDRGVVLGKGTVIAALIDQPGGTALALNGQEERILTLLSVARQELVDPDRILRGLQTVSRALQKGDSSLAAIALCQFGQPPLADERLAKTLTWAECRLAKGRPAQALLKMQGLLKETITFGKQYDPCQPRTPAGNGKESGQWCSTDWDGTSGRYGDNTKKEIIRKKIDEALQGKKAIAVVGGAADDTMDGPAHELARKLQAEYPSTKVVYFTNDGKATVDGKEVTLKEWLASQGKDPDVGSDNVAVIGHSWGGDTAAKAVASGNKVGALITLDPVSHNPPDLDAVNSNAKNWINVNANPTDSTRNKPGLHGNFWAGIGGAWNGDPQGHASQHYNADINHAGIRDLMGYQQEQSSY